MRETSRAIPESDGGAMNVEMDVDADQETLMTTMEQAGTSTDPVARFPSPDQMLEFLRQVRIWNKVEGLPQIEAVPLADGRRVRFRSMSPLQKNVLRLIDAFGGFVAPAKGRAA